MKKIFVLIFISVILLPNYSKSADLSKNVIDTTVFSKNERVGKSLKTRGINLYYEIYGQGEPLLLIHGNGGSINSFVNQIPYFAKHFKVIAVDSRAQGKSLDPKDSLTYEMMADDFNALLDSLHINSCNVIGWSDGGIDGLLLAIRHADKVKKLAITGANITADTNALNPSDFKNMMKDYKENINKPKDAKQKNDFKLLKMLCFEPNITTKQLATIKCPTLVIGGDHDLIPVKHTCFIAQSIPNSFLWILPNSGHATLIEHKNWFNQVVLDFLKK